MKKEKLLTLKELKEDLNYLKSNEQYMIDTINLFRIFIEDRYSSEKSLSDGTIEIYELLLKEISNLIEHIKSSKLIYEEKLKRIELEIDR